jgi:hypothetical protein
MTPEDRLLQQGAHRGTVDAFSAQVRRDYAAAIARTLREVSGDPRYSLGRVDPEIMREIAAQIEGMPR